MVISLGFGQNLITNGNFESGSTGWSGNAVNVVTEGGNSYNAANPTAPGNPWDVNISYVLPLTAGKTYKLQFDVWSDTNRTIVAGIGLNEAPWSAATQTVNLTTTSQTITMNLVAPATSANSRVIFDMGAAAGFVGIDNVLLEEVATTPTCSDGIQNGDETGVDCGGSCAPCAVATPPSVAAPTPPARATSDVVSIFSNAYSNISVNEWGPNWGNSSARINDLSIAGNATKLMDVNAGQIFAGIDFAANRFDATPFTHFHLDFYIPSPVAVGQVIVIKLSNHIGGTGETNAIDYTYPVTGGDNWVSLDVPLSSFTFAGGSPSGTLDRSAIAQIVLTAARADGNVPVDIYLDNIYFHKNTILGVLDAKGKAAVKVYPNPLTAGENVSVNTKVKNLEIYNVSGQKVKSSASQNISTQGLTKGVYILKATTDNGEVITNKFIIK